MIVTRKKVPKSAKTMNIKRNNLLENTLFKNKTRNKQVVFYVCYGKGGITFPGIIEGSTNFHRSID